nr:cbb3-type cytochrome oxidase assembly protein CcoS [Niveibacterium umoris]
MYLLIPLSVVLVFLIGLVLWWSVRSGQFDDLEGPGYRVLMDDDSPPEQVRTSVVTPGDDAALHQTQQ